jgi:acetyl esterase/lipase
MLLVSAAVLLTCSACSGDGGQDAAGTHDAARGTTAVVGDPSGPPPVTRAGSRTRVQLRVDGTAIAVTIVLPDAYRQGRRAPVLLALPPGGQGREEVDGLLDKYWAPEAQRRGWVVVSPEAPTTGLYISGASARLLPHLLDVLIRWYPPEGGAVHLAGVSNGGLSAFRLALDHPDRIRSLLTAPGYPPEAADESKVGALAGIPVLLVVGGEDTGWRDAMEQTTADLRTAGGRVRLIVSPGESHIMEKVSASTLWDFLDRARPTRPPS